MSIFEHQRFEIWNPAQHPFRHSSSDYAFVHSALPGVTNIESAINWILAVLYPNTKAAVATPAALPLVGNTINDMRVVTDDGDGKAASYRWEQREGDVAAKWYKIYDIDWGYDSILSRFLLDTQERYFFKRGIDDRDSSGTFITGAYAGQRVYGGSSASTNLTLCANSGDGTGARTGYVQVDDNFRPSTNNLFDLGTASEKFKDIYLSSKGYVGTLVLESGKISDTSGAISFDNENILTTGTLGCGVITGGTGSTFGTITIGSGSITDSSGAISFGDENISTTGTVTGSSLITGTLTLTGASIKDSTGTVSFDNENITTTGKLTAGELAVDNISLDANTITVTDTDGNLILCGKGAGYVSVTTSIHTIGQTVTGIVDITGQLNADNLRMDGNTISSTNTNGDIVIDPNGAGLIEMGAAIYPATDSSWDLGKSGYVWDDLWIDGSINNGTNSITISTLLSLRNINSGPPNTGDALFYNSVTGCWEPSNPDTEILHSDLSGLTTADAGHTQFVMLAGRAGGQTIQGGTAASEILILESTANATKGSVKVKDNFLAYTNASYGGGVWSGIDIGGASNYFKDIYLKGEAKGLRIENYTTGTLPVASTQNIGRLVFATDTNDLYVDIGSAFQLIGASRHCVDYTAAVFTGAVTTVNIDVSANITDARKCIVQLLDNANDFERVNCTIKATSASNVRIVTNVPLPAGTYRLVCLE